LSIATPAQSGFCPVPDGELYYEVVGTGPAVVFVHAGIADLRMWDEQAAALADMATVIRYDCRGFGRSRSNAVPYSNRADLIAVLDHLGVAQATLVGCSRGGMIALDTAVEFPDRVNALVWVCSFVNGWNPPEGLAYPEEEALEQAMMAAEEAEEWERVAEIDVRLWVDGPQQPEGRAAAAVREKVYTMALNNYTTAAVPGAAPQPLDPPAAERLGDLTIPVLAIVGDLDSAYTPAAAEFLAQGAPNVRIEHFPDCAHLPNMEQPERFNALLREFL
jgi:pimeloyl-ACP methyl ester carboxylesterase